MKKINNFITEKLKINSKSKINIYSFKPLEDDIEPFWGYNWIISDDYLDLAILLLEWAMNNCHLTIRENTFIEKFYKEATEIKKKGKKYIKYHNDCRQILNGSINNGYYTRPKCLYDIATLIINNKDDIQNLGQIKITDLEDFIFDLDNITNKDIKKLDWVH